MPGAGRLIRELDVAVRGINSLGPDRAGPAEVPAFLANAALSIVRLRGRFQHLP